MSGLVGSSQPPQPLRTTSKFQSPPALRTSPGTFETESIRLFPETEALLLALKKLNVRIGLCSNLASPYEPPGDALLPFRLYAYAWSFEVGAVKPDAASRVD